MTDVVRGSYPTKEQRASYDKLLRVNKHLLGLKRKRNTLIAAFSYQFVTPDFFQTTRSQLDEDIKFHEDLVTELEATIGE